MAFTDALIAESDADVVMVDRRYRPGGHWNDAYPFVRLHQPSACYGVNSRVLGNETIDETGPNAGFYERSSAAEIYDYYQRVLDEHLLPSGQVRFFGMSDYAGNGSGEHRVVSRLTGEEYSIAVRQKVVDATYAETSVPSTHTPSFGVDSGVRLIPPNDLVNLDEPVSGYTVLGGGKTAMDTCNWLLDNGVDPGSIRWIRPREAWVIDRSSFQPRQLVTSLFEWLARGYESAALAEDVDDLFRRLEECEHLHRLNSSIEPTMYCAAILSEGERASLRRIENVVRLGRVQHLGPDRIVLEQGSIPTDREQVHVDCTASGTLPRPARPIFEPGRISIQAIRSGNMPFNAALIGYVEVNRDEDAQKNQLCPPNPYPNHARDWISNTYVMGAAIAAWAPEQDLQAWLESSRLNVAAGAAAHMADRRMQSALARMSGNLEPALVNMQRLLTGAQTAASTSA